MGTYAYVRKARCRSSNQIVAIKVSRGTTSSTMLKSEYDILKQVSHRCIPRVFKFEENVSKHESYIIMEYFEGVTLDTRITDNGVMNEDESKAVIRQLLSVVQYLHSIDVAHRDIKPENVLINDDNEVKLIDFNISKHFDRNAADDKFKCVFYTQISSPLYSAPELKTKLVYNESVDIWGVGTILFTLLFGAFTSHLLNKDKNVLDRSSCIRDIIKEDTKISEEWRWFILSILEDESNNRPTAIQALDFSLFQQLLFYSYTP